MVWSARSGSTLYCGIGNAAKAPAGRFVRARYTRMVGHWHVRAVSALVIALLAGGPSIAVACDVLCSDRPHETAATEATTGPSHHHAPAVQPEEPAATVGSASNGVSGHDHHQSAVLETLPESATRLSGSSGRDCCSDLGHPRLFRTAARVDTSLISTPEAAALLPVAALDLSDRHARGTKDAPPPRPPALGRTTHVLRI